MNSAHSGINTTNLDSRKAYISFNKFKMTFETEFMIIGSRHNLAKIKKDPIISIREKKIQRVRKTKSLGSL